MLYMCFFRFVPFSGPHPPRGAFIFCLLLLFSSWEILWISLTLTTQLCKRNTSFAEISRPADFITYWTYRLNQFLNIENQKNPTHPVNGRPGHPSNGCKNLVENAENALMQSREFPNDEVSHVKSWESGVLTQSALTLSISYFETHQLNSNAALYIYTHQLLNCCFPCSQPPKSCYFQRSRPPAREKDPSACASVMLPIVSVFPPISRRG